MEKRLKKGELIGKSIEIIDSKNKANIGLKGIIIDETRNTLQIKTKEGKKKMLIKEDITFVMKINNEEFMIKGDEIRVAPEERIKLR